MSVVGVDQSARGTAAVVLEDGKLAATLFYVQTKKDEKLHRRAGALLSPDVRAGDECGRTARLAGLRVDLARFLSVYPVTHAV